MNLSRDSIPLMHRPFKHAYGLLVSFFLLKLFLHLSTNWKYGFHRDEFYYILGGNYLDWGYVDHPPLTPFLARIATSIFGLSLSGLRLFPALAGALVVVLTILIVRRFGGQWLAQLGAALAVLLMPLYLGANTLFQTVSFDQLWWVLISYLLIQLITVNNPRIWLLIGLAFGLGWQTKYTIALFGMGVAIGIVVTPLRSHLRTPWPWLGLLLAATIALPNLLWQYSHDFPTREFIRNNSAGVQTEQTRLEFLLHQLLLAGPMNILFFLGGWRFFWSCQGRQYRVLGWAILVVFGALLAVNGKSYYAGPLYPLLCAGGAVMLERRMQRYSRRVQFSTLTMLPLVGLPLMLPTLPILPVETMVQWKMYELNKDLGEMIGWPDLISAVAEVYQTLPPEEQANTRILSARYGEAAAIELFDREHALPATISGHNSYYFWSNGRLEATTYIVLGYSKEHLLRFFEDVQSAGVLTNSLDMPNEMYNRPIYLCYRPKVPLQQVWDQIKQFD
jgi:hypothetical protein